MTTLISGRKAVIDALKKGLVKKIICSDPGKEISHLAKVGSTPIILPEPKFWDIKFKGVNHQFIAAEVFSLAHHTVDSIIEEVNQNSIYLILDHIQDSGNFGSIIRTAESAGVEAIFVPSDNQAPLDAHAMKVSQGAALHVPIIYVSNIANLVEKLKKKNIWVAATAIGNSIPYTKAPKNFPLAIVVGNEDKGVSKIVQQACDFSISIPMHGYTQSLNVAVATGIVLYKMKELLNE